MIKEDLLLDEKKGIRHVRLPSGAGVSRPWLGGLLSYFYDSIMANSLFPGKFGASYSEHQALLKRMLSGFHGMSVLELATGSGNLARLLPADNHYFGVDSSEALLRRAVRKFRKSGIASYELYACPAEHLPFASESFDAAVCNLSFNFFDSIEGAVAQTRRVLKPGAPFIGSIPVPERNSRGTAIHGRLLSETQFRVLFEAQGFDFHAQDAQNGVVLYFRATRRTGPGAAGR